jgi:hypothetical protein
MNSVLHGIPVALPCTLLLLRLGTSEHVIKGHQAPVTADQPNVLCMLCTILAAVNRVHPSVQPRCNSAYTPAN